MAELSKCPCSLRMYTVAADFTVIVQCRGGRLESGAMSINVVLLTLSRRQFVVVLHLPVRVVLEREGQDEVIEMCHLIRI